jgi:hypothetical protein
MTRSVLRIVLDTHGYNACIVTAESEIWELANGAQACLVVGCLPPEAQRIEQRCYRCALPCVIAMQRGAAPEDLWIAQLLECLHRVLIRKRGPKAGITRPGARECGANAAAGLEKRSGKAVA